MEKKGPLSSVNCQRDLEAAIAASEPVLALFYTSWCPFCTRFLPVFQKAAGSQQRRCLLVEDDQETMAADYSVAIYPTVLYFEKGAVCKRLDGRAGVGLQEQELTSFLTALPPEP